MLKRCAKSPVLKEEALRLYEILHGAVFWEALMNMIIDFTAFMV